MEHMGDGQFADGILSGTLRLKRELLSPPRHMCSRCYIGLPVATGFWTSPFLGISTLKSDIT